MPPLRTRPWMLVACRGGVGRYVRDGEQAVIIAHIVAVTHANRAFLNGAIAFSFVSPFSMPVP